MSRLRGISVLFEGDLRLVRTRVQELQEGQRGLSRTLFSLVKFEAHIERVKNLVKGVFRRYWAYRHDIWRYRERVQQLFHLVEVVEQQYVISRGSLEGLIGDQIQRIRAVFYWEQAVFWQQNPTYQRGTWTAFEDWQNCFWQTLACIYRGKACYSGEPVHLAWDLEVLVYKGEFP